MARLLVSSSCRGIFPVCARASIIREVPTTLTLVCRVAENRDCPVPVSAARSMTVSTASTVSSRAVQACASRTSARYSSTAGSSSGGRGEPMNPAPPVTMHVLLMLHAS